MKYLILGSSGQVGMSLTKILKNKKHEIINFDLTNSPEEDLRIRKNPLLIEYMQQADFVFF